MFNRLVPIAAIATLATASAAQAHTQLVSANPAPNSTVATAPGVYVLTFNERVLPRFVTLEVTGPGGAALHVADITVDPQNPARISAPVHGGGQPGVYRVAWTAAGSDMHRMSGSYTFTVRP